MPDHFARDSLVRRIDNEPAVALLAGRALVLQLALPAVAHGVDDHSDFRRSPFKRLLGTAQAMYAIVNGSEAGARGVGERIQRIHEHVVGPGYRANQPENLMWVHATLVDSALLAYTRFVGSLSTTEVEGFYQEMKRVASPLGLPVSAQPGRYTDFRDYFSRTVAALEPDDTSRRMISYVMRPVLPAHLEIPLAPVLAVERLITIGTLPAALRDRLGMGWDRGRQRQLDAWTLAVRTCNRVQPRAIRTAPTRLGGQLMTRYLGTPRRAAAAPPPGERRRRAVLP